VYNYPGVDLFLLQIYDKNEGRHKMKTLNAAQAKSMMIQVAGVMVDSKEIMCEADRNIGDGDHGIGMANGFDAARQELDNQDFDDVYKVFFTVGRTMIKVMGGASGIIFGTLFYAGSKNMEPKSEISLPEFTTIFDQALIDIKAKGQAKVGDKTVVDALEPMVDAMKLIAANDISLADFLQIAYDSAVAGKESSKQFIAKFGKAKTLGERAVGYPDAGAVSLTLIMKAMLDWAKTR
jgi:dihydroxyacetone kinase phosphoprotein-dependent L subunit